MAALTPESIEKIEKIKSRYPSTRSALIPALYVAQDQDGHVTDEAISGIAGLLGISPAEVKGVSTFYTMYYRTDVGKHIFQVCGTLSCALCGAEEVINHLSEKLGVAPGETTEDGLFMFEVVECLGACGTAPVMLYRDNYYEKLTLPELDTMIDKIRSEAGQELDFAPQLKGILG